MARQWLRKPELNEKLWKGDSSCVVESNSGSNCRTALSAESLAKMFLLVVANSVFLLAALHVLHSKREFGAVVNDHRSGDCVRDRLNNNVHPMRPMSLPAAPDLQKNRLARLVSVPEVRSYPFQPLLM